MYLLKGLKSDRIFSFIMQYLVSTECVDHGDINSVEEPLDACVIWPQQVPDQSLNNSPVEIFLLDEQVDRDVVFVHLLTQFLVHPSDHLMNVGKTCLKSDVQPCDLCHEYLF